MNYRTLAEQIFLSGIESVLPGNLIGKSMSVNNNCLSIGKLHYELSAFENIYVIGAGKASAFMGSEVEKVLGDKITGGHIVTKYGHSCKLKKIVVTEAGHPVPDVNGFGATEAILDICDKAASNDIIICLLSGGGSALLSDYPEGSSSQDIILVNDLLVNSGATIKEINTVRKHLSKVKGGHLAKAACPATLITLIISDVPGDLLDVIASGPTTPDPTTFPEALEILSKYDLANSFPRSIVQHLKDGYSESIPETPKPGDPVFGRTFNFIVGNNRLALESAKKKAEELSIKAIIVNDRLQGDVSAIADYIVELALKTQLDNSIMKPVCLLLGGEPSIKMTGKGLGGRNQHLALSCALLLRYHPGITILSAGTDGTDGPTDATGAVVDSDSYTEAIMNNLDPAVYLNGFDSYNFFKKSGGQIITGPTMTNVMDLIIILIW